MSSAEENGSLPESAQPDAPSAPVTEAEPSGAHTPGPWTVRMLMGSPAVLAKHPGVAHLPRSTGEIVLATPAPHFDAREREANARLIAAAPELLAAARQMLAAMGERSMLDLTGDEDAAYDALEAAVTQATGPSQ